jgi:nucleotide-binding universal stress UspA family protein
MTVVVGYLPTAEGRAALRRAAEECRLRGTDLVVIDAVGGADDLETDQKAVSERELHVVQEELDQAGVSHQMRPATSAGDLADDIVSAAEDLSAEVIVIGLRRRSPVGKLVLGSSAQRVLLDAPCAVLAVKAAQN